MSPARSERFDTRALLLVAAIALAACGGSEPPTIADSKMSASTTAPAPGESAESEHSLVGEIVRRYGDELAKIGVEVGRAGLTAGASSPGYVPDGDHLAIYVSPAPDADSSPEAYAQRIVPLTELFVRRVFDEWPGIQSFDVCQEPAGRDSWGGEGADEGVDDQPPLTVLLVRRDQADAQTWTGLDLAEVRRRSKSRPKGLSLVVTEPVAATRTWRTAAPEV